MTTQRPDATDHATPPPAQREDACGTAPKASIGTLVDNETLDTEAPLSPHGDSIRRDINGSEREEDTDTIVYDDRTDDRPAP